MTHYESETMTGWERDLLVGAPNTRVAQSVLQAIRTFLQTDLDLLSRNVHEQAITSRLADHLRRQFPEWHVDCEYNREGEQRKRLSGRVVKPDIIIHRRGTQENFLVIEVKKSNSHEPDSND